MSSVTKCGGPNGISSTSSLPRPPLASKLLTFSHPSGCCESSRSPLLPESYKASVHSSLFCLCTVKCESYSSLFAWIYEYLPTTSTEQVLTASPSLLVALHIYVPLSST